MNKKLLSFSLTSILLAFTYMLVMTFCISCDDTPPTTICHEIDGADCPGAISSGAILSLTYSHYETQYTGMLNGVWHVSPSPFSGGIPSEVKKTHDRVVGTAGGVVTDKYIDGYEINWGAWSRDSYRRYSFKEIFAWKHGREWTPSDGEITDQQARDWFNERHTVERLLDDDPPRDVNIHTVPMKTICTEVNQNSKKHAFDGEIHFPNGARCQLDPNPTVYEESIGSSGTRKLKIRKPCAGC